jgi:hypothetical protein
MVEEDKGDETKIEKAEAPRTPKDTLTPAHKLRASLSPETKPTPKTALWLKGKQRTSLMEY